MLSQFLSPAQLAEYPEFRHLCDDVETLQPEPIVFDSMKDPIVDNIFAPDPKTGFPRSDLALAYARDTRPEISQYIQQNLIRPMQDTGIDDADFALQSVRNRGESIATYAGRLRDLCQASFKRNEVIK